MLGDPRSATDRLTALVVAGFALLVLAAAVEPLHAGALTAELAGVKLPAYPYFDHVRSFNPTEPINIAIDPYRAPSIVDRTCRVWIVAAKTPEEWTTDPALVDVRLGDPQIVTFGGGGIRDNIVLVAAPGELRTDAGPGLGVAYDVVLDCDQDGTLGDGDWIDDGGSGEAGMYAVHDTTQPGPLSVEIVEHSGGPWLTQRVFYPENIAELGQVPLIAIGHGWTHEYTYYDHIGNHLASYGYVVMTFVNDVGSGDGTATQTASTTTLTNTDYILGNLSTIAGGVLDGHVDGHRIVWIGHSTGGEAVVRAYTRLRQGDAAPLNYTADDIVLISSIAPVVFLPESSCSPMDVNYHMFLGAADTDTSGAPLAAYTQSLAMYERATGNRQLIYVHGAGHADFHDGGGSSWAFGPDLIGRPTTHTVVKGYYLPLMELYTKENPAAIDFFARMDDSFRPAGIPSHVIIANEYKDAASRGNFAIDDYEFETSPLTASSGGTVASDLPHLDEVVMKDEDGSFAWTGAQPSNGMTRSRQSLDEPRGAVLDWNPGAGTFYEIEVIPPRRDFRGADVLSFRACQGTRHPETVALNAALSFAVTLRDGSGTSSTIPFGQYGKITRPYLRTGSGAGAGWQNEFSTVRIDLDDFTTDGNGLDLGDIEAVRFEFGGESGAARGRIGIDDIELARNGPVAPFVLRVDRAGGAAQLDWGEAPGANFYNVYRGTIPPEGLASRGGPFSVYDQNCFEYADEFGDGLGHSIDAEPVPPGVAAFYYLVSVVRPGGVESLGDASIDLIPAVPGDQLQRLNSRPCP